jgi:Protein of unknown function (DUF2934)
MLQPLLSMEEFFSARDFHNPPGTLLKLASALSNTDYGWHLDCSPFNIIGGHAVIPENNARSATQKDVVVDPVLPDQGGRMTHSDPPAGILIREEYVRIRAYQIYEARGRVDGNALQDWLLAESELNGCEAPLAA